MANGSGIVNVGERFKAIDKQWSADVLGRFNDLYLKAIKVQGDFDWHKHEDTDEFFFVISGSLFVGLREGEDVTVEAGEFFVVPRGLEHCTRADQECEILLLESVHV